MKLDTEPSRHASIFSESVRHERTQVHPYRDRTLTARRDMLATTVVLSLTTSADLPP